MTKTDKTVRSVGIAISVSLMGFSAAPCWAATAALPWDYTLIALQDMLITYIAPAAIGLALSAAIVLYALGGRDEQAGRLFGSALGGGIALAVVKLLNCVLP